MKRNKDQILYKIEKLKKELVLAKEMNLSNVIKMRTRQISVLERLKNSCASEIKDNLLLLRDEMEGKSVDVVSATANEEILKWMLKKR